MSLLNVFDLSFRFSSTVSLFHNVTFAIEPGDRLAVVGPNGAGKTTLLRILAGELEPATGVIARRQRLSIAAASGVSDSGGTLYDCVFAARADLSALRARMQTLELQPDQAEAYADAIVDFDAHGGYAAEAECERILLGLGFAPSELTLPLEKLSGGQRTRAGLARALHSDADILLLDEPTSHLDLDAREWLEEQLADRTVIFISHDRAFLANVATRVLEIQRGEATLFEGGYDAYRERRALLERQAWDAYDGAQRRKAAAEQAAERRAGLAVRMAIAPEGARHSHDFYRRKAAKVARTGRILRERAAHEEQVEKPWQEQPIPDLDFGHVPRAGDMVLTVDNLAKSYGERALFEGVSFHLARGERLALTGRNGSGKTTLLRILLGQEQPDQGQIRWGANTTPAYFAQAMAGIDRTATPLDLCGNTTTARTLLACLKLRPDRVTRPFGELSAGERTKVALTRVMLSNANVLVLDEPTDNLEVEAQEALEQALQQYPGAILLVSHDRAFLGALGPSAKIVRL